MAADTSVLSGLEPRSFWEHFEALTKIARPSRHEEPVIEHVRAWADQHGFELQQDAGRNLVIRVPATPGREGAPMVTLQGHLDMVCERVLSRETQGSRLADKQMVQDTLAESWMELEQFRLFVLRTAWKIDRLNDYKAVREDIAAAKVLASRVLMGISTRAMHLHGSLGISNEMPFGDMLLRGFVMGIADGPDEVHKVTIARQMLRRHRAAPGVFPSMHVPAATAAATRKYADALSLPGDRSPWIDYVRGLPAEALDDA